MKMFTDRHEIAQVLNFGKYIVIDANLDTARNEYGWDFGKIRLDLGDEFYAKHGYRYDRMNLWIYQDALKLTTSSYGTCIHSSFGLNDVEEMVEYATSPIIKMNEPFILFLHNSSTGYLLEMKPILNRNFCSTPVYFEEDDMSRFVRKALHNSFMKMDIAEA